jgi:F420-non-reducing hydrogenase iron-sulfur subunit
MRLTYPTNVKVLKVPCTGRVDVIHILKAFEDGADGVYLAGCLEGECHFLAGNLRAKKRVGYAKQLLDEAGIGGERVAMYNLSSAQGQRFAEIAREMTGKIKELGPSPMKKAGSRVQGPGASEKETKGEHSAASGQ